MLSLCFPFELARVSAGAAIIGKRIRRHSMGSQIQSHSEKKDYAQYNHTDSCKFARWTAKESYDFMYARAWQDVVDFYSDMVAGRLKLSDLFGTERARTSFIRHDENEIPEVKAGVNATDNKTGSGRWARANFKIIVSYHGASFDGWQKQPGLNTVQGLVEKSLGSFVDENKAKLLIEKCKPLEGGAVVAGRTDKGVSALQQIEEIVFPTIVEVHKPDAQVIIFVDTWRKDVKPSDIEDAIKLSAPGKIRVVSVSQVSRVFHPNFSAKWRRYLYIFPLCDGENWEQGGDYEVKAKNFGSNYVTGEQTNVCGEKVNDLLINNEDALENGGKPRNFTVSRVNLLLRKLEGKLLSYKNFARDTKASRNIGPPTECFIYHARATEATVPCPLSGHEEVRKVMCVELVGNRFLRRMVRVLVSTSVREAAAGADEDALLKLMDATCRRATAPPAPPDGLCLVDVGYSDFDPQMSLIE